MKLDQVQAILEADVIVDEHLDRVEVDMGCGADLMSDVLAFGKKNALLLTGLQWLNVDILVP